MKTSISLLTAANRCFRLYYKFPISTKDKFVASVSQYEATSITWSRTLCLSHKCWSQRVHSLDSDETKNAHRPEATLIVTKKRIPRKKAINVDAKSGENPFLAVAYSSAEEYSIPLVAAALEKHGLYKQLPLPADVCKETLHVTTKYQVEKEPKHIYFYSEGSVVFWNVPDVEQKSVLDFLKPYQIGSYAENSVLEEKEHLEYYYTDNEAKFTKGHILLEAGKDSTLETYTFSNALALSVKLALWEASLESFVDSIEWVTDFMKDGKQIRMSRAQVFKKRGELFALRHAINLSSDLLDTPDFYWDRQHLEVLYQQTYNHLNISKRTRIMNERLSYCSELIDLLSNHMNDKHHVRLELMIIALIMVEVMFEFAHFILRFYQA